MGQLFCQHSTQKTQNLVPTIRLPNYPTIFSLSRLILDKKGCHPQIEKTMGSDIPYDKSKARSPTFTFHFRMAKCNTVQQDGFKTHPSRTPPVMLNVSSDLTIRCPVQIARRIFSKTSMPSVFCDTFFCSRKECLATRGSLDYMKLMLSKLYEGR